MTADRDAEIRRICQEALDRPAAERERYLAAACVGDARLRQEIDALLAHDASAERFLTTPAFEVAAHGIATGGAPARRAMIGTRLGQYEVLSLLGVGGMGEVYRARDTRLGRDVAVKILPDAFALDADRLARFRREAHLLASLNHPHIAAIYGLDEIGGVRFLVLELVDGETLAARLAHGPLRADEAVGIAKQIAEALEAAHEKGIIHRDLKPANIALTRDGRVKVLDFGLAKATDAYAATIDPSDTPTMPSPAVMTSTGVIIGTAAYMSPEQARGRALDKRVDIWAFGCVLYEMLTGRRPFEGETVTDVIANIIHHAPAWNVLPPETPAGVRALLARCLAKDAAQRLRDIGDAQFDLDGAIESGVIEAAPRPSFNRRARFTLVVAAPLVALGLVGSGLIIGQRTAKPAVPVYQLLTFQRDSVMSARFSPDGETIIYSAAVDDQLQIFSRRMDSSDSRPIGVTNADILSVSSRGEMAVLLIRRYLGSRSSRGTLARMSLLGGAPREMLDDVQEADWSPDGTQLAVVRWVNGRNRIEYPIGHVLYESDGFLSFPRVSPSGQLVAFMDHPLKYDNRGSVVLVDAQGHAKALTAEWGGEGGLAWSSDGREVWFTASTGEEFDALRAVTLDGRQRVIARAPGYLTIQDIRKDGRALMMRDDSRTEVIGLAPGEATERDLTWFSDVGLRDLSVDGKAILFTNFVVGTTTNYSTYLRRTDGSPAVRLGDGDACAFSPDGTWVAAVLKSPSRLFLLPTGAGDIRPLDAPAIEMFDKPTRWIDATRILFAGKETGHDWRSYVYEIESRHVHAVTPEGVLGRFVSPDGKWIVAEDPVRRKFLYRVDAAETGRLLPLTDTDGLSGWSADGQSLFLYRVEGRRIRMLRLHLTTGLETPVRETTLHGSASGEVYQVFVTPDAKSYVYQLRHGLADLYLVNGLK